MNSVYSFADVTMVISQPNLGQYVATGQGIGSVSVAMTTDKSAHDVAGDGSIMVSKILGNNGNITLVAQQTSELNSWLTWWYNYLLAAPTSEWATTKIIIRSSNLQQMKTATGVSPQKLADTPYQAQGQQITWVLMAADIQQNGA